MHFETDACHMPESCFVWFDTEKLSGVRDAQFSASVHAG